MNTIAGHVEDHAIASHSFLAQQRSFAINGFASNPSTSESAPLIVGDLSAAASSLVRQPKKDKRKRKGRKGDLGIVDGEGSYQGPWASWEGDEAGVEEEETEEAAEEWRQEKKRRDEEVSKAKERAKGAGEEKSIFHGSFFVFSSPLPASLY